jgi:hypothetical protein
MCFYGFIIIRLIVVVWGINLFSSFLFPLLYLLVFPFSSSPLLVVYGSILSHVSMLAGSRGGELKNPHLHLYLHITSPIDRCSFAYSANFMAAGSRVSAIEHSCPVFGVYILHPKLWWSTIRPQTPRTHKPNSTYDDYVWPSQLFIISRVFKVSRVHGLQGS